MAHMLPQDKKSVWGSILSLGSAVANKAKYGSAMDSILILVGLVTLPCLIIYVFIRFWLLLVIASFPILFFARAYDYFMKKNPKMLRTEKHEETMFRIASSMGQKGQEMPESVIDTLQAVSAEDGSATKKPELLAGKVMKGKHA